MTRMSGTIALGLALLLGGVAIHAGCGNKKSTAPPPADTTAPAAVADLAVTDSTTTTVTLTWTASGDDGSGGSAASYDLRYDTSIITASDFANATRVDGVPAPKAAGQAETFTVSGLLPGTAYWFAVKTADEVPNLSAISNVVSSATVGEPPPPLPTVTGLTPVRTVVGDTVVVRGLRFGADQGTSAVLFAGTSGVVEATVLAPGWSDTRITVLVPAGAADGNVVVRKDGTTGPGLAFTVAPFLVSYRTDLLALFDSPSIGCHACHGGTDNLFLDSPSTILQGNSLHGPVVTPRDGEGSVIVKKVRGTAGFGERMPRGAAPLSEAQILLISDWIDQGARDN